MDCLSLRDLSLRNQRVLMRVDFNVPLQKDGSIADDARIRASLPSIEYILHAGASLVLMSHLGRPQGRDLKYSLAPCAKRLSELLKKPVLFAPDAVGAEAAHMASHLQPGQILMLENLRFHPGEEEPEKDLSFVQALARLGDLYVNDAFGTAHRAHASTAQIASFFPKKCAAGFLMEKELQELSLLLHAPKRPFFTIIGGAKVSTKIGVIKNLLSKVDALFLGGAMTYTFLQAKGIAMGDSLVETNFLETAKELLQNYQAKIYLPADLVIASAFENNAQRKTVLTSEGIPTGWQGMDIGPKTVQTWGTLLAEASTIFWNGPVGVFEMPHFALGTRDLAQILARCKAKVLVGGGDSIAAIEQMGLTSAFSHLSTGGGASLEYLEFGHLPGIDALIKNK